MILVGDLNISCTLQFLVDGQRLAGAVVSGFPEDARLTRAGWACCVNEVRLGFGRIVALHRRSSASHQIC